MQTMQTDVKLLPVTKQKDMGYCRDYPTSTTILPPSAIGVVGHHINRKYWILYITFRLTFSWVCIYRKPLQDVTQGQLFSGIEQVWIQNFSSSRLIVKLWLKSVVYPTILSNTWRTDGFKPLLRTLARSEKQTAWSRIWNRDADLISKTITVTLSSRRFLLVLCENG